MFTKNFRCTIHQSVNLFTRVIVAYIVAALAVSLADLPVMLRLLLLSGLLLSGFYYWRSWQRATAQQLYFHPDTGWRLGFTEHESKSIDLTTVFVSQRLIVMYCHLGKFSGHALLLTRDNTDPASLRQLKVLLLHA